MWPWRVKIHATFPSLTSCRQYWQPCCWRWNKTKAILLMPKQNKTHAVYARWEQKLFVDAGAKQKLFCQCHFLFQNKQRPCCWCRMETKAILLMSEQLKGHIPFICHFFTQTKFLENKIYTEKRVNYDKIHSKLPIFCVITAKYTVNCQFFALNL